MKNSKADKEWHLAKTQTLKGYILKTTNAIWKKFF